MKKATPEPFTNERYYENNGLRIPLYDKSGRKKTHARHAQGLRKHNLDQLLDIVEEYAGTGKRKQFKDADVTKAEISDWIETVETFALPPNPKSKLSLPGPAQKKDTEVDTATNEEPAVKTQEGKGKVKAVQNQSTPEEPAEDTPRPANFPTAKRKHNDATPSPTHASHKTPPKKLKIHHEADQQAAQSRADKRDTHQAKRDALKAHFAEDSDSEPEIPSMSNKDEDKTDEKAQRAAKLINFMGDVGMHPDNVDTSSMVVNIPENAEDRVLMASTLKNSKTVMHDTPIPHDRSKTRVPIGQPAHTPGAEQEPFFIPGTHGRGGDFEQDPDRRTGRGHQITPEDAQGLEEYFKLRGAVLKKYPKYPRAGEGGEVEEAVRTGWEDNEAWFRGFNGKYKGRAVGHLWPCGCERMRGESEEEESEEE